LDEHHSDPDAHANADTHPDPETIHHPDTDTDAGGKSGYHGGADTDTDADPARDVSGWAVEGPPIHRKKYLSRDIRLA
jgi:hypothetical protein